MVEDIISLAEKNLTAAEKVIQNCGIIKAWQDIGAEINLVDSVRMGLLMTHRDIDFHIYTQNLSITESFKAVAKIAAHPGIEKITYENLLNEEDSCLEWHAWYRDNEKNLWQIEHIRRGSVYDGFFEKQADRICAVMTPAQKEIILRLKYETPAEEKIGGIEYYMAVIRDGIKDWKGFSAWRKANPQTGIISWLP